MGHISIRRLGVSAAVPEGTGNVTLRRAVGHIAGTALPGGSGNVGLSAHRDTFRERAAGEPAALRAWFYPGKNWGEEFVYPKSTNTPVLFTAVDVPLEVEAVGPIETADAPDVSVLDPDSLEVLTLVTCYPFYFVVPAPRRFIVRAVRVA
jgi:sortase A